MPGPSVTAEETVEAFRYILGIGWTSDLIRLASPRNVSGAMRRGLATPATNQPPRKLRTGLHVVCSTTGGEVDVEIASWWASIERRGTMEEAPRNGWDARVAQLEDWLIFDPNDLYETRWASMNEVLQNAEHCQLTLELWIAETATEPAASGMRRRELAIAQLNP